MKLLTLIGDKFSGSLTLKLLEKISSFHRIQASPGFREAAYFCWEKLKEAGVEATILSFPAREGIYFWTQPSFQEWAVKEAWCYLEEPREEACKLADFAENPISLIQRSAPFDGKAEVVLLENWENPEDYRGLDLKDKVVLTSGEIGRVREMAVEKFGAIGILFDGMRSIPPVRERVDLPDAKQYTSFWWESGGKKCFGFVLTPRQGEKLRNLLKQGKKVTIRAKVDSIFYDGSFEVVEASIPGLTDEWMLVVAHLCHPSPSANDNASGAAVALESAMVLSRLIREGSLPIPKRGILFLLVPEITGMYAYLSSREDLIPKVIAGLNLDMVGQNQELCRSNLLIEHPPASSPTFVPYVLAWLMEEFGPEARAFSDIGRFFLFRWSTSPFSGGSDHYVLSDPTVGIPTPMIIQWPDRFYHTDYDTPDKADPKMLWRIGTLVSTCVYLLAGASEKEILSIGYKTLSRLERELSDYATEDAVRMARAENPHDLAMAFSRALDRLDFRKEVGQKTLAHMVRFWPEEENFVKKLQERLDLYSQSVKSALEGIALDKARRLGLKAIPEAPASEPDEAFLLVPVRLHKGPPADGEIKRRIKTLTEEEAERWYKLNKDLGNKQHLLPVLALYWADGHRSIGEIAKLIELETGISVREFLKEFFRFLEKTGFVELKPCTSALTGSVVPQSGPYLS